MQRRVAAIHDLSGLGRCSLSVIMPVLAASGAECCALPTALVSSHTGGLAGYTYRGLTDDMAGFARQWSALNIPFSALYSGFLGSARQIEVVSEIFSQLKGPKTVVLVDPVMADHGKLYKTYTEEMAGRMVELCRHADIITPNLTEAGLLLGLPYRGEPKTEEEVTEVLRRLAELGPRKVVLTGVSRGKMELGSAGYDRETGSYYYAFAPRVAGSFPGTGDLYSSALLAGLLRGKELGQAMQIAVDYTQGSIARTWAAGTDPRLGVNFEAGIPGFIKALGLNE